MENNLVKCGFVSIIGLPNAGKSTLLNAILKDNLAITSKKPQTTRKNLKGIYNDENSQIVFIDTPGIHAVKNQLDDYMKKSIDKSIDDIDLVIAITDIMTIGDDDYSKLCDTLSKTNAKKILVLNKFDVYSKENVSDNTYDKDVTKELEIDGIDFVKLNCNLILDAVKKFQGINFEKVFVISALKKKHISDLIDYVKEILPEGPRFYNEDDLTDEPMKQIVSDMIRQQCLYKLDKEVPHGVAIVIDSMKTSKSKCMNIDATIVCEKESHKGIIIGKAGGMIKNIGTGARIAIEDFMKQKVNLKLNVIVRSNWRDEKTYVANYGYDIKSLK